MTKPLTPDEVRLNLDQAIDQLGGPTQVAARCRVTEHAVSQWKKRGHLNGVRLINAIRFAKAAKQPVEHFVVSEDGPR